MRHLFALALALLLSANAINAEVIFDSVDLTSDTWAWFLAGGPDYQSLDYAYPFDVPEESNFTLEFLELRLGHSLGPNEITVMVHEDAGLELGAVVERFFFVDAMPPHSSQTPLLRIDSLAHPLLRAGNRYWVAVCSPEADPDSFVAHWFINSMLPDIPFAFRVDRGAWYVSMDDPAEFRVSATPVPACSDGLDNDGDGLIDYPSDPGCFDPGANTEAPACQDGDDNDGDGLVDFDGGASAGLPPAQQTDPDPECPYAWQMTETPACGIGIELTLLLPPLMWLRRRRALR